MTRKTTAPYGSWKSPIDAAQIAAGSLKLGEVAATADAIYWNECRPAEGGRYVIVRQDKDGEREDMLPAPFSARTRVHEYGGGAWFLHGDDVYFSNDADQRIHRISPGGKPKALTPPEEVRYADGSMDGLRNHIICVREDHRPESAQPINAIVSIDPGANHVGKVLVSGNEFYASPRLSPDGNRLAWLTWNHPDMPWDAAELWVGEVAEDGTITDKQKIAGGPNESCFQPEWSPDGELFFVSDRTNWWNLYRLGDDGAVSALTEMDAEFGMPQWVFGMSTYAFLDRQTIVAAYTQGGKWALATLHTGDGGLRHIETPYSSIGSVCAAAGRIVFLGGSPVEPASVVAIEATTGKREIIQRSSSLKIDAAYISEAESVEFDTENGLTAHGLYYPPRNADFAAPEGELPPLVVMIHGGPTAATGSSLKLSLQYYTSRGIAVLDVNYGGSTGYGREYRERLHGQWGIVDVDDCCNGALAMAKAGKAEEKRLAITGGSAGGYTTLSALTFRKVFAAGASHFGVSDCEALATETHKFESRYLDKLIGPYPEQRDLYKARSPINHTEMLDCPVAFFQGLEDAVVPPNQAEMMVEALKQKRIPVVYVPFEGEQHGFRKAENITRALESELYFFSKVFGFELGNPVEPLEIENL
jgi:dipeptidyl aminopeptidase/acylaminoacyl peptidase